MRLPLALALALLVAGCVTPPPAQDEPDANDLAALLAAVPKPALDGEANLKWLASFVAAHAPRLTGTPSEKEAGDSLAAQLAKFGYAIEDHKYSRMGLPNLDGPVRAVVAVKEGSREPERMIILGAHYDTAAIGLGDAPLPVGVPPREAAYDNGSGTAIVIELARLLQAVETNKTIAFVLFNGEEEGVWGSEAYANELVASKARVDVYVGFDMVGINWPSEAGCLCIYAGEKFAEDLNPVQEAVAFEFLEYPRSNETVQIFDNHKTRNSDEFSFQNVDIPTMRWAGMKSARDYWAYHKLNDTIETMEKQAGSRELLVAGTERTAESAYYTVLAMDARG